MSWHAITISIGHFWHIEIQLHITSWLTTREILICFLFVQLSQRIVTMTPILAATLLCLLLSNIAAGLLRCSQVLHRPQLEFQLIRSCSHSKSAVLASDRVTTLEDCTQFAAHHQALALNFANPSKEMLTKNYFNNSKLLTTD